MAQRRRFRPREPFIYNPSEDIRRNLAIGAKGIDEAFEQRAQKRTDEYEMVKAAQENVEGLSEQYDIHHSQLLSVESDSIISDLESVIFKDGQMNHEKMGEVNRRIRGLKTMNDNSKRSIGAFKEFVGRVGANPEYVKNPTEIILQAEKFLKDPNLLKSPDGILSKMDSLYSKNIDYDRLVGNGIKKSLAGYTPEEVEVRVVDESGNEHSVTRVIYEGLTELDSNGNVIPTRVTSEDGTVRIPLKELSGRVLSDGEKGGFNQMLDRANGQNVDDELFNMTLRSISGGKSKLRRTKEEIDIESEDRAFAIKTRGLKENLLEMKVEVAEKELANWETEFAAKIAQINASTARSIQSMETASRRLDLTEAELNNRGVSIGADGKITYDEDKNNFFKQQLGLIKARSSNEFSFQDGASSSPSSTEKELEVL